MLHTFSMCLPGGNIIFRGFKWAGPDVSNSQNQHLHPTSWDSRFADTTDALSITYHPHITCIHVSINKYIYYIYTWYIQISWLSSWLIINQHRNPSPSRLQVTTSQLAGFAKWHFHNFWAFHQRTEGVNTSAQHDLWSLPIVSIVYPYMVHFFLSSNMFQESNLATTKITVLAKHHTFFQMPCCLLRRLPLSHLPTMRQLQCI